MWESCSIEAHEAAQAVLVRELPGQLEISSGKTEAALPFGRAAFSESWGSVHCPASELAGRLPTTRDWVKLAVVVLPWPGMSDLQEAINVERV